MKKIGIIFLSLILQSCQVIDVVIAQSSSELQFETKNDVKYAAEVLPDEIIEQITKEISGPNSNWIGDPRRFKVRKIQQLGQSQTFYYINPMLDCPEWGCDPSYHTPFCGMNGCNYYGYLEENGKYRQVFHQLFQLQGSYSPRVSRQLKDGVPACFELPGYDRNSSEKGLPELKEDQIFKSRYCYNGTKYVLTEFSIVPLEWGKNNSQ